MATEATLIGPRLQALQRDLAAGHAAALEAFWQDLAQHGAPLIEPLPGEPAHSLVTFVYRAPNADTAVSLAGQLSGLGHLHEPLARLPGTDVLYRSLRARNDLRGEYRFAFGADVPPEQLQEQAEWPDPLNPHRQIFPGGEDSFHGPTDFAVSVLALPNAPPQPWLSPRPGVAPGRLDHHRFRSAIFDNERIVSVYTPAGYQPAGQPYPLVVLFDRWTYAEVMATPTTLDNLIAAGAIPPVVVVLISHIDFKARMHELACNPANAEFLAHELVPWVRGQYHVTTDPARTVLGGISAGGLAAVDAGRRHPEVFGKVLCQSGAVWWKPDDDPEWEWVNRQFAAGPRLPLAFYLEAGLLEDLGPEGQPTTMLAATRRLRAILQAKGYPVRYSEFNGAHVFVCWQGSIADGLIALLAD